MSVFSQSKTLPTYSSRHLTLQLQNTIFLAVYNALAIDGETRHPTAPSPINIIIFTVKFVHSTASKKTHEG